MHSRPLVRASLEHWSATAEQEDAIRAQLRGLGAQLLIVSGGGALLLGPDDTPKPVERWPRGARPFGLEITIVDCDGVTRWSRHLPEVAGDPAAALLGGLREAVQTQRLSHGTSRRELLVASLVTAFAFAFSGCGTLKGATKDSSRAANPPPGSRLHVNGALYRVELDPRVTLLDALRETLQLTGTKKGCDMGQCGACTVLVDGLRANACLLLAVAQEGKRIATIEGLADGVQLHPLQAAFIEHDALQCGYCTPGQIMSALGLYNERQSFDDDVLREELSGNLCRCGAYSNIIAAVRAARARV